MKNLLLHVKYVAMQAGSDEIEHSHLIKAISNIESGYFDLNKDVIKFKNDYFFLSELDELTNWTGLLCSDKLKKAEDFKKIPFSSAVKSFIKTMKEKGYSVKTNRLCAVAKNNGVEMIKNAKKIKESLSAKLYGQDLAIEAITDSIKNNILANTNNPKSTYLFLGPPATGKTYLADLMGEHLDGYEVKKIDMTQYSHDESGGNLYGTSRHWGNAKVGMLTSFVRKNPKSIIVLDEFEKASNQVQTNLLTIFEGGYMIDACGWCKTTGEPWNPDNDEKKCEANEIEDRVDFKNTIFIITSNLGKELYSDGKFLELIKDDYNQAESMILDTLQREKKPNQPNGDEKPAMVPELISRLSQANIVLFNKLNFKAYNLIADQSFKMYKEEFTSTFGMKFNLTSSYKNFLKIQILGYSPQLDARRIKSKIGINFFDKITDFMMKDDKELSLYKEIKISISKKVNDFIRKNINDDIENEKLVRELFRKNLTLDAEESFTYKDGVITYSVQSCEFAKVKRVKDFNKDGLVFDIPDISFDDIAGHSRVKTRLNESVVYLKKPDLLKMFGAKVPKGILLYGPPGTGKTMLAKAFAHESKLPFIATTGTDLLNPETTKKIFSKAKEYAPSIIFIDELDALGSRKDERYAIPVNKLLSELDGFSDNPDENIFVIAATNFKDRIDNAITRAGRIELHVEVGSLDKDSRKYFIENIIKTKPVEKNIDIDKIVMYTSGMNGAELENIGKEASLYCLRHDLKKITQEILIEQINTIKYGEKSSDMSIEEKLESTAIHEAGHAVLSKILMPHKKIEQITIVAREKSLGYVSFDSENTNVKHNVKYFKDEICVALAGRVAEINKYGKEKGLDYGAISDLGHATEIAYKAIAHLGMDDEVGYINIDGIPNQGQNKTKQYYYSKIDDALSRWLKEGKEITFKLVEKHWDKIEKLSDTLLNDEIINEEELELICK